MNIYLRLIFIFTGIWFVASLINGVLSSICLYFFSDDGLMGYGWNNFEIFEATAGSMLLSIPFVFLVWLIVTIACINGKRKEELYQFALRVAFIVCACSAFLFAIVWHWFQKAAVPVAGSIVVSGVSAVLLFRQNLKRTE